MNPQLQRRIWRRDALSTVSGGLLLAGLGARPAPAHSLSSARFPGVNREEWETFRSRYVTGDGRVVDTGNGNCSHTEGQGWGMLFAVAFDDRESFEAIRGWTASTLRRSSDSLHAWRYRPGDRVPVADWNNATDGDIFVAAALWRAALRWQRPDYAVQARTMAQDILTLLVRPAGPHMVLLPGVEGFVLAHGTTVNLSYYAFPMMADLALAFPSPLWPRIATDGMALLQAGRFGSWKLPPDWLRVDRDGRLRPDPKWPPRFSYDAIRIPLYLSWSGLMPPQMRAALASFWVSHRNSLPAWVDLMTEAQAGYQASPGFRAVAQLALTAPADPRLTGFPADIPSVRDCNDYYAAALVLLSRLAWQERGDGLNRSRVLMAG
ncbi:putative endoglucanase [Rhodovastum atsumiense]|uniref:glycosyl hydrolase family 8 n=1 Tax=Rhodovastum atsumiense TaxID=504468 RepID=UPI00139F2CA3|nr:glycosyl hydrolase family 8 [Rhodovastum atsumiense]CAH2602372.1 putative endoglucanase [Rhodovastum atsumiense]